MIEHWHSRYGRIVLVNKEQLIPEKNIFSILVGKNGTGKSTILGQITKEMMQVANNKLAPNDRRVGLFIDEYPGFFPSEVISVSTSPFDKFPIHRVSKLKNYTYLGLRDVNSVNIGIGYLSKIIGSLIESIIKNRDQSREICNVLNFLEYRDEINITFDYTINPLELENSFLGGNLKHEFDNRENPAFRKINRQYFINQDNSINEKKLHKLEKTMDLIYNGFLNLRRYNLIINRNGFDRVEDTGFVDHLVFLYKAGVIKLKDVFLRKIENHEPYSIKDSSSGEQSILLSILGIASKIKDNCLILIDEPETCLHPQWQETYIDILTKTFDKYINCHFVMATHSPLIISRLSNQNSFIIDIESKEISNAELFINHSSDFQLANVFNHPGFRNEYLLRIAMNIFVNVSKNKFFSKNDDSNFKILQDQSGFLREDDPVYDLYKTIKELKKIYG